MMQHTHCSAPEGKENFEVVLFRKKVYFWRISEFVLDMAYRTISETYRIWRRKKTWTWIAVQQRWCKAESERW